LDSLRLTLAWVIVSPGSRISPYSFFLLEEVHNVVCHVAPIILIPLTP
jgi:hypothetical protein